MSQQLRVTRKVDFTGATQIGFGNDAHLAGGKVLFVDGINGADGYEGTNPNYPLLTIVQPMSKCTSANNDYIFVLDCWDQESAWPITLAKQQLHIVGLGLPSFAYPKMQPDGAAAVFKLTSAGAYSEIAGFDLSGGTTYGCIWIYGTEGAYIHDNWFGSAGAGGTPKYGIYIDQNPQYSRIERNRFFGDLGSVEGLITENGVHCAAGVGLLDGVEVINNVFSGLAIAMYLDNADY